MTNPIQYRDKYLMSNNTFLLMGQVRKGQQETIVYDNEGVHVLAISTSRIIRGTAKHYGHTLKSLTTLSREFFGEAPHKLPICLTTSYNGPCVIFPLLSPRTPANIWVNTNTLTNICQSETGTLLTLKHGHEVTIPFHYLAFCSQYSRASMFSKFISTNKYL